MCPSHSSWNCRTQGLCEQGDGDRWAFRIFTSSRLQWTVVSVDVKHHSRRWRSCNCGCKASFKRLELTVEPVCRVHVGNQMRPGRIIPPTTPISGETNSMVSILAMVTDRKKKERRAFYSGVCSLYWVAYLRAYDLHATKCVAWMVKY